MSCRKLGSDSFRWSSDKMAKKNKKKTTPPKLTGGGKLSSGLEDSPAEDDIDLILEQGRSEGDPFHAVALFKKVLQAKPEDTVIMGEAAELLLQVGETAAAKEILARSISLAPEEEPDKYLNMAQLHEGRQALDFYEKGLEVMHKQLSSGNNMTKGSNASLKQRLCMAYCSVGELYLTDLCFEEGAEKRCQDALDESMKYDYGGPEPPHTMANLRLSQHKFEEAVQSAEESFRRLGLCEPPPEQEFRVSLAKILLECSATNAECSEKAIEVLEGVMQEDDENVEVWYLLGVAFNSLQPPDSDGARAHLERAGDMLSKIRTAQEEMGENFAYEDQVRLVQEQLEQMGKNGENSSKAMHEMPSVTQTSEDMDCA